MAASMRIQTLDWAKVYERYASEMAKLQKQVRRYETLRNIKLTPGAMEVLLIPFVEELQAGRRLNFIESAKTIKKATDEMAAHPDARDDRDTRSSWSALRAFWKKWCNIPPICGPTNDAEKPAAASKRKTKHAQ